MTLPRVAIVGLNRTGMHLLQQLHFRPDFFVVAVCETNSVVRNAAKQLCEAAVEHVEDLAQWDWETVIVCGSSMEGIRPLLRAGRTVAVVRPTDLRSDDFEKLRIAADQNNCRLTICCPHHADLEFSAAKSAVSSSEFGPLRTLDRSISSAGLLHLEANSTVDSFAEFAFNDLAQAWDLLRAAGTYPHRMTVQAIPMPGMDGEARGGYLLLLREPEGVVVEIRRNVRSVISEDTGWQIAGTNRGFRNNVQIVRTSEGEIYELSPIDVTPIDPLESLLEPISPEALVSTTALLRCFKALQSSWKNDGKIEVVDTTRTSDLS